MSSSKHIAKNMVLPVESSSSVVSGNRDRRTFHYANWMKTGVLALLSVFFLSCRGQLSEKPPIHPNLNMDQQARVDPQEDHPFFEDRRAMRQPVEGTVARGKLKQDAAYYEGVNADGSFVEEAPVELTRAFIHRGKDRYNIYCTPCHGGIGNGRGIIMTGRYGYVPTPSFHEERIRNMPDGELFSAIANGVRTMPSYAHQVKVEDRWAIVSYIRALQNSQNVPEHMVKEYGVDLAALQDEFQRAEEDRLAREEAIAGAARGGEISAERGEKLYIQNGCQACHSRDGSDGIGPSHQNLIGREEQMADGTTVTVDEEYLYESIVEPNAKTVDGYDPVMASYSYLSDDEIYSIIEYLKTLSDN